MQNNQEFDTTLSQPTYLMINLPSTLIDMLNESAYDNGVSLIDECLKRLDQSFSSKTVNTLDFLQEKIRSLASEIKN